MSIVGSDPLAFLTSQGGVVGTPLSEDGAEGVDNLDVKQRNAVIGEPIPIVFCRRVSGIGGVLISPPATEAAFSNNANNDVTASYLLVLSEGQIDSIQVRDVFQGACRVGSYTQTYNRRAGTFVPGNTITDLTVAKVQFSFNSFTDAQPWTWYDATLVNNFWKYILGGLTYTFGTGTYPGSLNSVKQVRNTGGGTTEKPDAPTYCGTGGTYQGLSTMAFSVTIPSGFDQWNRQVHCFIRGGIYVPRLLDSVTGPSNNVADLLLYLFRNSSRVPEAMIDTASLLAAATFTDVNGFWFNGVVSESTNLRDWIGNTLQYFLLRQARVGGKEAIKPLVPTNANGTIKTTAVTWAFTFTEEHIIPDSFDVIYTPLADRKPFCAVMLWRQQDDLGIPVMRTTEVRYTGTAPDGPFEQHDISGFCSSENHAVKVGAYILSKRNHVTHRLQLGVKPDSFNPTLAAGDLVRVRLERTPSTGASSLHDYLYEVDRISKSLTGEVRLDLTHFPVDANKASVVAQEVNAAVGGGLIIGTGASAITCDINSFNDTSVPAESFTSGTFPNYGSSFNEFSEAGLGDPPVNNFADDLGGQGDPRTVGEPEGLGVAGTPLDAPSVCSGQTVQWTKDGQPISGATSSSYTPTGEDIGANIAAKVTCPDGSEYVTDPVVPSVPQLDYSAFGTVSGTVQVVRTIRDTRYLRKGGVGLSPVCDEYSQSSFAPGSTLITNFGTVTNKVRVRTVTIAANGDALSPALSYTYMDCPNPAAGKQLRRNGALATVGIDGLETVGTSGWGANLTMNTYTGVISTHSTIITGFILSAPVAGLGNTGDNVVLQGIQGFLNIGSPRDVGQYVDDPNSPYLG